MKKILIIEDNPINLKLVSDVLIAKNFEILQATTGKNGLNIAEKNHSEIGLILLDLKLPDTNGIEVIKQLKANQSTLPIPVIVVSAQAMECDKTASKNAGCADYVTKPINVRELLLKVEKFIQPD